MLVKTRAVGLSYNMWKMAYWASADSAIDSVCDSAVYVSNGLRKHLFRALRRTYGWDQVVWEHRFQI